MSFPHSAVSDLSVYNDMIFKNNQYGIKLEGHKYVVFRKADNKSMKFYNDIKMALQYIQKKKENLFKNNS